jgi:diguanylate cyclase (GGDEF)-like protein
MQREMNLPASTTPRHARTIQYRLSLIVFACILPMSAMVALLIYFDYARGEARATETAVSRARSLAAALDRRLKVIESGVKVLSTAHALEEGDLRAFHQRAVDAVPLLGVSNMVLRDGDGQQRLNTFVAYSDKPKTVIGPAQLNQVFSTNAVVLTDLFRGPVTGKPIFALGIPVHKNNAVVYALNAGILPERIVYLFDEEHLPASWIAVVFDSTGTIVARSRAMDRFVGQKVVPQLEEQAARSLSGSFRTVSLEGIPVMTVFHRSNVSNWTVAIGVPVAELTDNARTATAMLAALTALILALGLAFSWYVARRTAASIQAMMAPVKALSIGAPVLATSHYFREADDFAASLARASLALQGAKHDASHDPLTGLGNRALFEYFVDQQVALCHRTRTTLELLYIDLDGFKAVNDTYGHNHGDKVLCMVADRLRAACRASDAIVRLGGDEFAICVVHADADDTIRLAGQLIESISAPYLVGEHSIATISASIGIASYPKTSPDSTELLVAADAAMYRAKALGKRRYVLAPNWDTTLS